MADYPSITYTTDSSVEDMDGRLVERMDNGDLRAREMWGAVKAQWRLTHVVDTTDAATLRAHHAAHLDATFSFTDLDTGGTHTVAYLRPPRRAYLGGDMVRVTVELGEV